MGFQDENRLLLLESQYAYRPLYVARDRFVGSESEWAKDSSRCCES